VYVDRLALEDFRNYESGQIELDSGLNLVVGRNAQGKTNLLEAIYMLSGLGSPRASDATLIREGSDAGLIHGTITRGSRHLQIDIELRRGKGARALLNKTPVSSLRALSEVLVGVFFGPDELSLVKGSPDGRRRFIDDLVIKLRPARDGLRREWDRVLRQRNALLKSVPRPAPQSARDTLGVWDEALCRAGAALTSARLEALAALLPHAAKRYEEIAGSGRLQLEYSSAWLPRDLAIDATAGAGRVDPQAVHASLKAAVEEARNKELERGISLVGPQRDDVAVTLAGMDGSMLDARTYASQGDQRTSALALKLGEYDLLADSLGDEPILLLDDVFSELDPSRREWLANAVRVSGQSILTSAEPGITDVSRAQRVLRVDAGRVSVDG
jgi:DNA replication and repair protein RecF